METSFIPVVQLENLAFSQYLKDSRPDLDDLYIPDGSSNTLLSRPRSNYGYFPNGYEISLITIELFVSYFRSELHMINHHMGEVYL